MLLLPEVPAGGDMTSKMGTVPGRENAAAIRYSPHFRH